MTQLEWQFGTDEQNSFEAQMFYGLFLGIKYPFRFLLALIIVSGWVVYGMIFDFRHFKKFVEYKGWNLIKTITKDGLGY